MTRQLLLLLLLSVLAVGCPEPDPDPGPDPDPDPPPVDPNNFRNTIDSAEVLAGLASGGSDVKYLAPIDGRDREAPLTEDCYFQNMNRFEWHLQFLRTFPELESLDAQTYDAWVVQAATRKWWGGAVKLWAGVEHPATGDPGVLTWSVYSVYQDTDLTVAQVAEVDARLKSCIPFAADLAVYLPETPTQQDFATNHADELDEAGVDVVFPADLVDGIESLTWSEGEGYGTLRIVPDGELLSDYGPRDVVVVRSAPNDISIVAGLVTADPQNEHSHVNLRLQEKGIPNATIPAIYANAVVRALDGSLVHIVAEEDSVAIEPASLAEAEEF